MHCFGPSEDLRSRDDLNLDMNINNLAYICVSFDYFGLKLTMDMRDD